MMLSVEACDAPECAAAAATAIAATTAATASTPIAFHLRDMNTPSAVGPKPRFVIAVWQRHHNLWERNHTAS
jgi:hypothetical protein